MTSFSEEDLVLPSLKFIQEHGQNGLSTSDLLELLRKELNPSGEDLEVLHNRPDDKFSQKVRNLRSHNTLLKKGYVDIDNNKFYITDLGSAYVKNFISKKKQNYDASNTPIDIKKYFFLFLNINGVQFSTRIKNICKKQKITRVYQVIENYDNWCQLPNFGKKSLKDIELIISSYGEKFYLIKNIIKKYDFDEIYNKNEIEILLNIRKSLIKTKFIDVFINNKISEHADLKKTKSDKIETVINHRFGLNNKKLLSLEAISNFFGVTRERIRQIEAKFLRDLIDEKLIKILLLDLDDQMKKIKFRSERDINNIILGKFFLKKIELQGLSKLLSVFLNKKSIIAKPWYGGENFYFFYDKKIFENINDSFIYLKKIGAKKNKSKHEDFKSLAKFQKKYQKYYPSDISFYEFITSFENIILDRENDTIAYFRDKNFIDKKLRKLRYLIFDKIKIEDLFNQINRDYRYNIPSIKVMLDHLKLKKIKFDNMYVYLNEIDYSSDPIADTEEKIIELIKDNNDLLFIEKIQEVKFDYKLTTSSIYVYLNNNVLFKEVSKGIYTTADKFFSKYEMNLAVQERSAYRKKFKTEISSTWDNDKFILFVKVNYYNTISSVIYINDSINDIIGNNKYTFIENSNFEINVYNKVMWSSTDLLHEYKIKSGDNIKIIFDIGNNAFKLEKL